MNTPQWVQQNGKGVNEEILEEENKQIDRLFELYGARGKGEKKSGSIGKNSAYSSEKNESVRLQCQKMILYKR